MRIEEICKEKSVTYKQLAEKANMLPEAISRLAAGKTNPTLSTLSSIADALGVPITDLFEKEGDFVAFVRKNGVTHTFATERELAAFVASFEGCVELEATTKS